MRLATWNVLWRFAPDWRARERGIRSLLADLAPDVVGLQECWADDDGTQADVVAAHLGGFHADFAGPSLPPVPVPPEHPEQAGVAMGVGLVSRWPIHRLGVHELPVSHRQVAPVALEARIEHPDAPFRVVVAATEWEPAFADDHRAQAEILARLLATGTPDLPVVLLADLNCDRSQPPFAPFAGIADDTWEAGGGDPSAVTLSSVVPFAPLEAVAEMDRRIDHVLVAPPGAFAVDGAFTVDRPVDGLFPSDHFPVFADLRAVAPATG